ncbi:MAG: hypothetical protein DME89_10670 [Verrucomicrobia bacterium]|nr:MAG: hypothetical protein DME89_10670 [Verrucomicrobiota bacterium]PYL50914.1 MAG: hypothetical protein DMF33_11690 [Verrucomicrobiota bacterium]
MHPTGDEPQADGLGSARVSRAGERVLAVADFSFTAASSLRTGFEGKDCFGATPKPARETRALPRSLTL